MLKTWIMARPMNGLLNDRKAMLCVALAFACSSLIGCGGGVSGPKRHAISGTVNREGIPVDDGNILFTPVGGGTAVSGSISNGKYSFNVQNGVPSGKYDVKIVAFPLKDKSYSGRKSDAPILKDDRFKKTMPKGGWLQSAEIADGSNGPLDFDVE